MTGKVIITAALTGAATRKEQNSAVPYSLEEFAEEAARCREAGAAMLHVHARTDEGEITADVSRIQSVCNAIRKRAPGIIVNLTSSAGGCAEERLAPILAIKPEMASLNTNTMNFSWLDRKTGQIHWDGIFTNTFTMLQDFGKAMEENDVKPEIECYDIGGIDNSLLIARQGFFSGPMNFNFVWGVAGGQKFRPDVFVSMVNALPKDANFTTCGVGLDQFPANAMSCLMNGHMRVGLEDNIRMPDGELARGSWEQVQWAVNMAASLGREPATPDEARKIMGIREQSK